MVILANMLDTFLLSDTSKMIIDDRSRPDLTSSLGTAWRGLSDRVMGGVSLEAIHVSQIDGRPCLRLSGDVRLDNGGGFIQMALDLTHNGVLDASRFTGLQLTVRGNGESYNVHIRTPATRLPWQSYRSSFVARSPWHTVYLPFDRFRAHRLREPLDTSRLKRLGILAIGRAFHADLCVAQVMFY